MKKHPYTLNEGIAIAIVSSQVSSMSPKRLARRNNINTRAQAHSIKKEEDKP